MGFLDDFLKPAPLAAGITTIGALIAGLSAPKQKLPYSQSQEYLDRALAQERELTLAKIAAAGGEGGAAAGAAITAAKINAAIQRAALQEKLLANKIALKLQAARGEPELLQRAAEQAVAAKQNIGNVGMQGYGQIANALRNLGVGIRV